MPYVVSEGNVSVLYLNDPGDDSSENCFNPGWVDSFGAALDEIEASAGPRALITTAQGRIYSTGADLSWAAAHPDRVGEGLDRIQLLFARMLELPIPAVAAIQGHAFGAGAIFALAHDHRIMREDRGFFCLPGINVGVPYSPGIIDLVAARVPTVTAHELLTQGRRYGGDAARDRGIVDDVAPGDELLARAVAHANSLAHTRGEVLGKIKRQLYARPLDGLRVSVGQYAVP